MPISAAPPCPCVHCVARRAWCRRADRGPNQRSNRKAATAQPGFTERKGDRAAGVPVQRPLRGERSPVRKSTLGPLLCQERKRFRNNPPCTPKPTLRTTGRSAHRIPDVVYGHGYGALDQVLGHKRLNPIPPPPGEPTPDPRHVNRASEIHNPIPEHREPGRPASDPGSAPKLRSSSRMS